MAQKVISTYFVGHRRWMPLLPEVKFYIPSIQFIIFGYMLTSPQGLMELSQAMSTRQRTNFRSAENSSVWVFHSQGTTLTVQKFRRPAVQSSM